jgi:hypothetical protein
MNIIGENIQGREDPGKGGYMTAISKQAGALLAATLILAGCAGCAMGIAEGGTRESAITLVENTWTDGNITETMSEQWFAFTAISAGAYYLHVGFGTLTHLYVQAYDSGNNPIGGEIYFGGGGSGYTALTVRSGKTYLKIRP